MNAITHVTPTLTLAQHVALIDEANVGPNACVISLAHDTEHPHLIVAHVIIGDVVALTLHRRVYENARDTALMVAREDHGQRDIHVADLRDEPATYEVTGVAA